MNKNIDVQIREICSACNETGCVSSLIWERYWQSWDERRDNFIKQQTEENWSSSRINYEFDRWEKENPCLEYPEEDICPECEGAKVILKWISVKEFGDLLFKQLTDINVVKTFTSML